MKRTLSIDSQILSTIQSCARKTLYNFIMHVQPQEKAEALEKGSLMHAMLEIYYGLLGNCGNREKSDVWQPVLAANLIPPDTGNKDDIIRYAVTCGQFLAGKTELPFEEAEEAIYQFTEYAKHFYNDEWKPLAVEEVGSRLLYEDDNVRFIYNFKIDLIAQKGNLIAPFDHKTGSRRQNPSSLSNQFIGYAFGIDSQHVIVNKIGFQKTLKPSERFNRYILTIDKDRVEEWIDNTIFWCFTLLNHIDNQIWPMNLTSCDKYSGCIYSSLCEANPKGRNWRIERDYTIGKPWDVANILEVVKEEDLHD